jgi:hypothetical protein
MNNLTNSLFSMQDVLLNATNSFLSTLAAYVPSIIGAIVILLIGVVVARMLRGATKKILQWSGFTHATEKSGVNGSLQKIGIAVSPSGMLATLVYWIIFLIFLTAAFETLGLSIVVATFNKLIGYLPNVIIAAITVVLALLLGKLVRGFVEVGLARFHISFAGIAAHVAEMGIVLFGSVIALSQLGLDITIITANVTLIIAGFVAILVLSLGLGSRTAAANLINGYYTKQLFKKGTAVNLGGYKGTVKEVTNVAVILDVAGDMVIVPNEKALRDGSVVVQ